MATIKDFLTRIKNIEGVAGCLLMKRDGSLLGHIIKEPEKLSPLLIICSNYARDIMEKTGFAHCQSITFNRQSGHNFHIFLFQQYYLGITQTRNCPLKDMLAKVNHLLGLVKGDDPKSSNPSGCVDNNQASL